MQPVLVGCLLLLQYLFAFDALPLFIVVRLLETFEEQGHFCLVLELLGAPVLDVGRWGPWRQAFGGVRASKWKLQLIKRKRRRSPPRDVGIQSSEGRKAVEAVSAPPLSLMDVRQMAVHLCGALAFLHSQGLIHADVKPENVVRSNAEASMSSSSLLPPCSSPVKLVDFGNCLDANEVATYAEEQATGGFDVQTVTYRAPEVAAGLLLCSAMDMWSLGCLLLECASGEPLFTLPALDNSKGENDDLLDQIEAVVTNGVALDAACAPYQSAARYNASRKRSTDRHHKREGSTSLHARLEASAPGNHQFHDFIYSLLDVNPATRATAKRALLHPFLQAFFPFGTVFGQLSAQEVTGEHQPTVQSTSSSHKTGSKRRLKRSSALKLQAEEKSSRERKKTAAERAALARSKDLRQVLKIIPRGMAGSSSISPR
ncbi:hypothetical protein DVH05_020343 [Phytophthora capsici]|nr:hypothetical protein DVH05_020343 [Phytophthora capsici]